MSALPRIALITGFSIATIAALGVAFTSRAAPQEPALALPTVRVAVVEPGPTERITRLYGQTRAHARGAAAFTTAGRMVDRPANVGQGVDAGQVLARLDPLPLAHAVRAARAQVDDLQARLGQVQADRDRLRSLDASGAVAPAERERIESQEQSLHAALSQAVVGLDEARRQQREGVLRAPFSGEISAVFAEPGETIAAGSPVVALAGARIEVVVDAPESVWAAVRPGTLADVLLPAQSCAISGASVDRVATAARPQGGLFEVHIALPDVAECRVAPGLSAAVDLRIAVPSSPAVPVRAIVDATGAGASVLRLRGDLVERVPVDDVLLHGDRATVRGELEVGDRVVVAGLHGLVAGDRVEVIR